MFRVWHAEFRAVIPLTGIYVCDVEMYTGLDVVVVVVQAMINRSLVQAQPIPTQPLHLLGVVPFLACGAAGRGAKVGQSGGAGVEVELSRMLKRGRVDNLGAYRIPSETGLLIPSVSNSNPCDTASCRLSLTVLYALRGKCYTPHPRPPARSLRV